MGPFLRPGHDESHRQGPDEATDDQADQDAGEEVAAHDVATMTRTTVLIPFNRPPGVVKS
jgi:hypothetical protein